MAPFEGCDQFPQNFKDQEMEEENFAPNPPNQNGSQQPGPVPAGFLVDEGEDVIPLAELYEFGIYTPPPSPLVDENFFGFEEEEEPWNPEVHVPVQELVLGNGIDLAQYTWQQLGEYLEFLEYLEAEENGQPGQPQESHWLPSAVRWTRPSTARRMIWAKSINGNFLIIIFKFSLFRDLNFVSAFS